MLLPDKIPALISARSVASAATARGVLFDVSIAGISFLCPVTKESPFRRQSAPFKKDQFDTSTAPGEQSLSGYWVRSQDSWHLGAGVRFYEPGRPDSDGPSSRYRFWQSSGVDVWTEGQLSLLKRMDHFNAAGGGDTYVASAVLADGTDSVVVANTVTGVKRVDANGTVTSMTVSAFGQVYSRAVVIGTNIVYGNGFGLRSVPLAGGTDGTLYVQPAGAIVTPYYLKQRIIAVKGTSVYELASDGTSGTTPGDLTTVTPLFTHPDPNWTWTSFTETPGAIIGAGYSSGISSIYSWTLVDNSSGTVPKLGQPYVVAEFPPGETVRAVRVYLGAYIGIGTSRGLRVGQVNDQGRMQYGPLLFQSTNPVTHLAARDSFLYATIQGGVDGSTGAVRVDLGNPTGSTLTFPYAWDASTHAAGAPSGIAFVGNTDRVVIGVNGDGHFIQSATNYETSGWVQSGRIRFATTEPKLFRSLDVRADTTAGSVGVAVVDSGGSVVPIVNIGNGALGSNLAIPLPDRSQDVSYRLTLTSGVGGSPVVTGVGLKALPSPDRQRLVQYPLAVADREQDTRGNKFGSDNYARDCLFALERMEETATVVPVQDHRTGEAFDATIESIDFVNTSPRNGNGSANFGGIATVTLKKLA